MDLNFINKNTKILLKKNEQNHALMRARGSISKKNRTNFSKNGIVSRTLVSSCIFLSFKGTFKI